MSVTNVEQYEKQETKPARRSLALPRIARTLLLGIPLLLFALASLASLGFFLAANPTLGMIAAYVALAAGVLSLIFAFLFVRS